MLIVIGKQKWVREYELHLLTGISMMMIQRTAIRLEKRNDIYRDKKPSGYFLRLKQKVANLLKISSGKQVKVPAKWRHDCFAIQTLCFLKKHFSEVYPDMKFTVETDTQILTRLKLNEHKGKIPDGLLHSTFGWWWLEQEDSRKSGPSLRNQSIDITKKANKGRKCFVAYPHPNEDAKETGLLISKFCKAHPHERWQAASIRSAWGDALAPHIQFIRLKFKTNQHFIHGIVDEFELIDLPARPSSKINPGLVTDEIRGYFWTTNDDGIMALRHHSNRNKDLDLLFIDEESNENYLQARYRGRVYQAIPNEKYSSFVVRIKNAIVEAKKEEQRELLKGMP